MAGIAIVTTGLAGCASKTAATAAHPGPPAGGPTTSTAPSAPTTPTSAPSTPGLTVRYASPTAVAVGADGKTLTTPVEWSGCSNEPQLIAVSQDTAKVVVEMRDTSYARMGVMCPDIARTGTATLVLDAPLGSRQLVDGTTNAPITRGINAGG